MGQGHNYVGETGEKVRFFEEERVAGLVVRVERHGNVPDGTKHFGGRNRILLFESVTGHEPINWNGHGRLTDQFGGAHTGFVYDYRLSGSNSDVAG